MKGVCEIRATPQELLGENRIEGCVGYRREIRDVLRVNGPRKGIILWPFQVTL